MTCGKAFSGDWQKVTGLVALAAAQTWTCSSSSKYDGRLLRILRDIHLKVQPSSADTAMYQLVISSSVTSGSDPGVAHGIMIARLPVQQNVCHMVLYRLDWHLAV